MRSRCAARDVARCLLILMGCLAGLAGSQALGRPSARISHDLQDRIAASRSGDLVDVIIQGEPGSSADMRRRVRLRAAAYGRDLHSIGGLATTLPLSEVEGAASEPGVIGISLDRPVASAMDVAAQAAGAGWTRNLSASAGGPTGRGVVVAVIDSGIAPHEDLSDDRLLASIDFVDPTRAGGPQSSDPYGHGTHVAGTIAGRIVQTSLPDGGVLGGIAPDASLVSLRVLDHRGQGKTSDVIAALDWCLLNQSAYGIRVVNLSLGQPVAEPSTTDPLAIAVERVWRAGIVVVAAAGNSGLVAGGYGAVSSPGNDPEVITVGALDDFGTIDRRDDIVAGYSSRGPSRFDLLVKPDLAAPGTRIISLRVAHSTLDRLLPDSRVDAGTQSRGAHSEPRYFEMSGTSMAAAVVSGAVALILEADPTLGPDDVKARLMRSADHHIEQDIYTRGAGGIDVAAAIASTGSASASRTPTITLDGTTVLLNGAGQAWGDPEQWSYEAIYGDPAFWGEEIPQTLALLDDPCMTGEGISWQPLDGAGISWQPLVGEGISWQPISSAGISWQPVGASGISWQPVNGNGISWQPIRGKGISWQPTWSDGTCP